jgi:hypothetical protein
MASGDLVRANPAPVIRLASAFAVPQCFTFDESYSGIGLALCNASIMPIWA